MQEFLLNLQISKAWKLAGILRTVKKNIRLLKQNTYICSDSISEETDMFTIRKATTDDCALIRKLAQQVFPVTYRDILTSEQIDYMMEWMYSEKNIRKQMEEEGHVYLLAYEECEAAGYVSVHPDGKDRFHLEKIYVLPYFQGAHCGSFLFREAIKYIKSLHPEPCLMELNVNRHNKALQFYEHMGMKKMREGDFPIGNGFYMNDYIMGIEI